MNVMIKPVSGHCNLNCRYCFYQQEHSTLSPMTADEARLLLDKLKEPLRTGCTLVFQGGEPLLAGHAFYETVFAHLRRMGFAGPLCVQTNGTLLDDRFGALFREYQVLTGVSLDGDMQAHSLYRSDFYRVMQGIDCLRKHGCAFNILTVITDSNAPRIDEIFAFYRSQGFDWQQYIPCMDGPPFLSDETYGDFLIRLFTLWMQDRQQGRQISIRLFENLMQILAGYPPEECGAAGVCTRQYLLEADGSVYPCDFYVQPFHRLGNLHHASLAQLEASPVGNTFLEESWSLPEQCSRCRWLDLCRGGCKRYRDENGLFRFCAAYRKFFRACIPQLCQLMEG